MHKAKRNLRFVAGGLLAAGVWLTLLVQTTLAQTVTIGNSSANPVQVRDIDAVARQPFVVAASVSPKDGLSAFEAQVTDYGLSTDNGSQEIPKGYRFVIEYIWATAQLLPGEILNVDLSLPLVGMRDEKATYSFPLKDGVATGYLSRGPVVFHASYEKAVRLYLASGDIAARFTFPQALPASPQLLRNVQVYLAGYLEKLPTVHPRLGPLNSAPQP